MVAGGKQLVTPIVTYHFAVFVMTVVQTPLPPGTDGPQLWFREPNAQAQQPRQPYETCGPGKPHTAAAVGCSALLGATARLPRRP